MISISYFNLQKQIQNYTYSFISYILLLYPSLLHVVLDKEDTSTPNHEKMELNNTNTSHNEHESYATATMPTYLCFKLFSKIFGISDEII